MKIDVVTYIDSNGKEAQTAVDAIERAALEKDGRVVRVHAEREYWPESEES